MLTLNGKSGLPSSWPHHTYGERNCKIMHPKPAGFPFLSGHLVQLNTDRHTRAQKYRHASTYIQAHTIIQKQALHAFNSQSVHRSQPERNIVIGGWTQRYCLRHKMVLAITSSRWRSRSHYMIFIETCQHSTAYQNTDLSQRETNSDWRLNAVELSETQEGAHYHITSLSSRNVSIQQPEYRSQSVRNKQ